MYRYKHTTWIKLRLEITRMLSIVVESYDLGWISYIYILKCHINLNRHGYTVFINAWLGLNVIEIA